LQKVVCGVPGTLQDGEATVKPVVKLEQVTRLMVSH